jgi:small subunit ribosomal protein S1
MSDDNFEAMLNQTMAADAGITIGEKVTARVVSIGNEYIFLNLGTRSEGLLLRDDVEENGELTVAVGDTISVMTTAARDGAVLCATGMNRSSIERTDDKSNLQNQIKDAFNANLPVSGQVKEVNKGGFQVDIFGIAAFCPISQIELSYCEDPSLHVGQTYNFKIIKFEEGGRNIVLSRRVLLQEQAEAQSAQAFESIKEGDVLEGTVSSIKPYGAFVNISGVDGLVHVSELSHSRIQHPDELLTKGQTIRVQVKEINQKTKKISLSLKSLIKDPWDEISDGLTAGAVVSGRVMRIVNFGAFVEIGKGVEGLVHVSQMREGQRVGNPREVVSQGDTVKVRLLEIDPESKKISLALVDENAEEEKAITEDFRASAKSAGKSMGTLGDLFGKISR